MACYSTAPNVTGIDNVLDNVIDNKCRPDNFAVCGQWSLFCLVGCQTASHAQHVFDIDNVQANQSAIVNDIVNDIIIVDDIGVGLSSTRGWSAISFYMSPLERVYYLI